MVASKSTATASILLLAPALLLPGCIAKTAASVVTAPVKAASKTVDLATTGKSEAHEKRGRDLRKREERLGKLERAYSRNRRECEQGDDDACDKAREEYAEIQEILPTVLSRPR